MKNDLLEEIRRFRKRKILWAFLFILLGLLGFVIPILPGAIFVLLGIALLKPGMMAKIRRYFGR